MLQAISGISKFFLYIGLGFVALLLPFVLVGFFYFVFRLIKGDRLPKRKIEPEEDYKPRNFFIRLFWDFPRRFVLDLFERDPDSFNESGFHLFAGEQGSGKSIAMVEMALRLGRKYPSCKIASNTSLSFQDEKIDSWEDLIFKNNGTSGQLIVLDEIQNWFNCKESKDMPIDLIQDICQQRKQRKAMLGTSQVFSNVAKALRSQVFLLYKPLTIFGCLTIVRVYKPVLDDTGGIVRLNRRKVYFFVHDNELRNAYDTYERIERQSVVGYVPRSEQLTAHPQTADPRE